MAEGRISGLSIDLSMDTAELSRSMTNIKDSFRDIKRSAQVNLNNIKFDSKNVDTYKKNVDELSKSFNNQKKNVNDLKGHYDKMAATHGEASKEAQSARIEYNKQADELNKLGHALEGATAELKELEEQQRIASSGWTKIGENTDKFGQKLQTIGGGMKDVGKKMTLGITTPIIAGITASIKSFADLEQAVGGIETLFKDSSGAVIENSETAYKRAGVSGVDYMANVTAFSASLLQGLGGDTEKAAKVADTAMVDMSDNANKFGTNIGDIQNAYQGFAKGNFTMLDNLRLGYGGTQAEMARLVNESGVLGDTMEVTAETVKDVDFHTMIEAIHVVQTEMDITGTTVKEAEETVSGSFGMMKASFMDLSAGFGQEGANIEGLFSNLWGSVGSFTDNIKRVIGTMWDNLPLEGWQKWLGAITVAMGPLLVVGGTVVMFLGGLLRAIMPVTAAIAKAGSVTKWLALALKPLGVLFAALTGPIGITIGVIALLGTAFAVAYAKSETFRGFIAGLGAKFTAAWQSVVAFKDNLAIAFQGIFAIFKGDASGGLNLLRSIGLSDETIIKIMTSVGQIKGMFNSLKIQLGIAFSAIATFAQQTFAKIKAFWQSDGQTFIQAMINAFNMAKAVIVPVITTAFNIIVSVIKFAMPLVLSIITMVWTNIKGVINGALNIIMGLVRVFSGVFTGDFSKMWQGVKQIFSGAIQLVWNGFQLLFYGRILKGVGSLVKIFSGSIRSLWTTVVSFFKGMFTGAVSQVTSMLNRVLSIGRSLNTGFNSIIRGMVNSVINFFRNMFTNITTTVGNIRSGVQRVFSAMRDFVVNSVVRLKDGAMNGFTRLKDGAGNLMTRMKDNVAKQFTAMVDGAKQLPGKLGSAISNGASKAVDGVKSLGNKMTSKLGSVVNGVIDGLNSITSKIGISATIDKWPVPTFSTGTGQGSPSGKLTRNGKIAADTLATVGDRGKGNGKGTRELVHYPNGKVGLYDNDATIFAPKGTTIFSNRETESMLGQIPKFSEGTGLWGSIKQLAGKAVDYITNPKKIFDDLIALVGDSFGDMSGFAGNFIKGAWSMIKDGMFGWIKGKFSESTVGKSQKWMDYPITTKYSPNAPVPGYPTAFNKGHHYGLDYGTPTGVNITAPTAGTVSRMNDHGGGNVARLDTAGKATQFFLHMNSVKPGKVGVGESVGKSGNSGQWTTAPHLHWQHEDPSASYIQNRNTKNPLSMIKGHLKGGQILSDGLFNLHKGEYVINPNEPTEAMKLLAIVGKKLAGKSKQTREVASVSTGYGSSDKIVEVLLEQNKLLMESNNKMNKAINVLLGIEDKTGFDPGKAKKSIDRHIDDRSLIY